MTNKISDNNPIKERKKQTPRKAKVAKTEIITAKRKERKIEMPSDLDVARKMINVAQSASDRSLKYNLRFLTVKKLMTDTKCYYTDVEFEDDGIFARSFDRIDSDIGYVEGNVVPCTVDFNGKKSNLTANDIEILYDKIVKPTKNKTDK